MVFEDVLFIELIYPVLAAIVIALILYAFGWIVKAITKFTESLNAVIERQEKQERILFGEEGVDNWDGLIKVVIDNQKHNTQCRYALIELINVLRKKDIIDYDDDIQQICGMLHEAE